MDESVLLLLATALALGAQGAVILTLIPTGGNLSGTPGSTVGWGFSISNDTDYLLVSSADFCSGAALPPCPLFIGTFDDFIAAQHPLDPVVVGPERR